MQRLWDIDINQVTDEILESELYNFLESINSDFPIPLNQKTDLREYVEKVIKFGEIVAFQEENILKGLAIGYIENLKDNSAYISVVGVKKEFRGNGIGKKVVQKFIEICKEKNIKSVNLYTHKSNETAIKMYKALGFSEDLGNKERAQDVHFILQL